MEEIKRVKGENLSCCLLLFFLKGIDSYNNSLKFKVFVALF